MRPPIHFWDYSEAKTASVATVQSKSRKGWALYRVNHGFGALAGIANYEHALVGPNGELLKVSTRTVATAGVAEMPEVLALSMLVLLLEGVTKADLTLEASNRGLSRTSDLGAQWNVELRRWMVRPEQAADFAKWLPADAKPTFMFPSIQPKESECN